MKSLYDSFVFIFLIRYDIEVCKSCECDGLQIVRSSAYSTLSYIGKTCKRLSDNYLEYRRLSGSPEGNTASATSLYVRFVSDDTVHRKGFNLSFVAKSYSGKFFFQDSA